VSQRGPEYQDRTRDAQLALRGEAPPPVAIDKRLGLPLDLVTGRVVCASCGLDTLALVRVIVLPRHLSPEMVISGMRCRTCQREQAVTLTQENGAVILGTSLPRG
jgi:hypothetical protein